MNRHAFRSTCVATLAIFCAVALSLRAQEAKPGEPDKKIAALQAQRLDVLEQLVAFETQCREAARATMNDVLLAKDKLIQAKIEYSSDVQSTLALLKERCEILKQMEEGTKALQKSERFNVGYDEVLIATSRRLEAEIELATAKQSGNK